MAKEAFKRDKPHVNVGTIGHVDQNNPDSGNHDGAEQKGHGRSAGI